MKNLMPKKIFILAAISLMTVPALAAPLCQDIFANDGLARVFAPIKISSGIVKTDLPVVTASDFAKDTFGQNFLKLAKSKQLLSQDDPRLVKEGLAFSKKGGICGSTCVTNIAFTADINNPNERTVDEILRDVLTKYREVETGKHDPRMGTKAPDLLHAANDLPELKNAKITLLGPQDITVARLAQAVPGNVSRVIAASVVFTDGSGGHELVILKVDPKTNTLIVADPNYPGNVYSTAFKVMKDKQGQSFILFKLIGNYSENPNEVVNIVALVAAGVIDLSN